MVGWLVIGCVVFYSQIAQHRITAIITELVHWIARDSECVCKCENENSLPGGGGTPYSVLYGEAPTGRVAFLTSQYIKG